MEEEDGGLPIYVIDFTHVSSLEDVFPSHYHIGLLLIFGKVANSKKWVCHIKITHAASENFFITFSCTTSAIISLLASAIYRWTSLNVR